MWVIAPEDRTLTIYRMPDEGRVLHETATVTGEDVLPGITCRVSDSLLWKSWLTSLLRQLIDSPDCNSILCIRENRHGSADTKLIIDCANRIHADRLQVDLESRHVDRFVAISAAGIGEHSWRTPSMKR